MRSGFALFLGLVSAMGDTGAAGQSPSRSLTYLDDPTNPYYVHRDFPKLITPMWVGEPGIEAVVILAIDDMQADTTPYERFLGPIVERLKQIDGRAPISIFTNRADPANPQLQAWLRAGLSLECHTTDHPCPLLQKGDFLSARQTYESCIDRLASIPNNDPVAFRMPCCDSMNSLSPRFFAELFRATTPQGRFLQIDSSVFHVFTPDDPSLPRTLVFDADGSDRFRKYVTFPSFVNTIENYPYPYVIAGLGWEFPCMAPSDWEGQNRLGKLNPQVVEDWKAALDLTVAKQGVMTMVFHPHGWIESSQIVELIDHAVATHGPKVKFLTFPEALERLNRNVLGGRSLRITDGTPFPDRKQELARRIEQNDQADQPIRLNGSFAGGKLLDLDGDGYLDVVFADDRTQRTRRWNAVLYRWEEGSFPLQLALRVHPGSTVLAEDPSVRFGRPRGDAVSVIALGPNQVGAYTYRDGSWIDDHALLTGLPVDEQPLRGGVDRGIRFRDLDHDGRDELLIANLEVNRILRWDEAASRWTELPIGLPGTARIVGASYELADGSRIHVPGADAGTRFVDLDRDGYDDVVFSGPTTYGIWLFDSLETGWTRAVVAGSRSPDDPPHGQTPLPPIVRADRVLRSGRPAQNGFWVHSGQLWWQNEDTAALPQHVDRRSIAELLRTVPTRPRPVEQALRSFDVRPGFRVEVVAAEPLIADPVALDVGADGRLWVAEMGDYPLGGDDGPGSPGGRIRVLEDADGDGRYDRSTIFLDGLRYPNGVTCWREGVIVTAAPDVFYAADTDGDGKADHREVLLSGFDELNPQHRVNGFALGLDGWLYGADGSSDRGVLSTRTGSRHVIGGRDFRFHPDTGAFALTTGRGQFGRQRNDWDDWFANDNSTWARHLVLDDEWLAQNRAVAFPVPAVNLEPDRRLFPVSPIVARFNDLDNAGLATSANTPAPYRDDLLGPTAASSLFISEPVHNLVHRMRLVADGVTYRGVRAADETHREFLASADTWFRPTMIKTGPDGGLWIADMYRAVIEHPEWIPDDWEAQLDLRAGHDRGRIYRVLPVHREARPIPRLDRLDSIGLVAALDSPNGWQRDTAMRLLLHAGWDETVAAGLRRLAQSASDPRVRIQALATLHAFASPQAAAQRLDGTECVERLSDPDPEVRRFACLLAVRYHGEDRLRREIERCVRDDSIRVRHAAALALGKLGGDGHAAGPLYELAARDGRDPWMRMAIVSAAGAPGLARRVTELWLADQRPSELAVDLLADLWQTAFADTQTDRAALMGSILDRLLSGQDAVEVRVAGLARLLDQLARYDLDAESLAGQFDPDRAARVREGLRAIATEARAHAARPETPEQQRVEWLQLLGRVRVGDLEVDRALASLLAPEVAPAVRRAAVTALAARRSDATPGLLLAGWASHPPALRRQIVELLLSRKEWIEALLDALAAGTPQPTEIGARATQRLLHHEDAAIRDRAGAILRVPATERLNVIADYRAKLPSAGAGDATAGRAVFERVCATCHELGGLGHAVGPDLRGLTDRSTEALLVALFDPNRAVEPQYTEYIVETADGRVLQGLVVGETATSVTLRRAEGETIDLSRADIRSLEATGRSLMPEGLEQNLTPRDVADLLVFLDATLPPPKIIEGNRPMAVTADGDGVVRLRAESAEIRGDSLTFEPTYKNLGYWMSDNDNATWTFDLNQAGTFEVVLEYACPADTAGGTLSLQLTGERLEWTVTPTAGWDDYQTRSLGTIRLPAGRHRLVARAGSPIRSALLDLRALSLIPRPQP
ncbi:MAG: hypothetical protein KatS3mg108_1236 [Isosphaeraceae bacterium]|jgi:putative membrane-bound dehydrogenase-like protein|nr:MAG: hypothetical protein KatS3mg108_1236 [Isosphaeraceae bacterium]